VLRLAQEREARRRLPLARLHHQQVDADQRLDTGLERLAVELHHGEQVVLVGHRDRGHAGGRHRGDELRHAHHAVEERIFRMQAQMHEAR